MMSKILFVKQSKGIIVVANDLFLTSVRTYLQILIPFLILGVALRLDVREILC